MNIALNVVKSVTPSPGGGGNLFGAGKPSAMQAMMKPKPGVGHKPPSPSKLSGNKEVLAAIKIQKWYRTSKQSRRARCRQRCGKCCSTFCCCCCHFSSKVQSQYIQATTGKPTLLKLSKATPASPKVVTTQPKKTHDTDNKSDVLNSSVSPSESQSSPSNTNAGNVAVENSALNTLANNLASEVLDNKSVTTTSTTEESTSKSPVEISVPTKFPAAEPKETTRLIKK